MDDMKIEAKLSVGTERTHKRREKGKMGEKTGMGVNEFNTQCLCVKVLLRRHHEYMWKKFQECV